MKLTKENEKEIQLLYNMSKYCSYNYMYCSGFESVILELHISLEDEFQNIDKITKLLKDYNVLNNAQTTFRYDDKREILIISVEDL